MTIQPPTSNAHLKVLAAGSLREVLTAVTQHFGQEAGQPVALEFGASGILRQRIEQGEPADVFVSADLAHPQRLADGGCWTAPRTVVRNRLCALVRPGLVTTPRPLLDALLDPAVRVGTSTPGFDPSGDYAWAMFERADAWRPGSGERLRAKALPLTGNPDSPRPPAGRGTYAWIMQEGQADVFLTYYSNALAARAEWPDLQVVALPGPLQVGAAYGLTTRRDAGVAAQAFAKVLESPYAHTQWARHGFDVA